MDPGAEAATACVVVVGALFCWWAVWETMEWTDVGADGALFGLVVAFVIEIGFRGLGYRVLMDLGLRSGLLSGTPLRPLFIVFSPNRFHGGLCFPRFKIPLRCSSVSVEFSWSVKVRRSSNRAVPLRRAPIPVNRSE